ncbi:c-type cytochrome, methanol metabolism-related [Salinarimonas soli]|uniref:C-type cytochrome, methanol metabolism-related n=1 Tax=Salinarimonas soli TaxID=1638099 RepID=A0A5B2VEF8_9HYPH|nr:c-type cytochrome, methanol metabolism-related [Salinarimonas soli]KAA2237481.1 c-type cytochrome, methanol metabolism-related [Salinarimonas soli]
MAAALATLLVAGASAALAEPAKAVREENGKYFAANDAPTYNVKADGTVDWYTFSGYRRYHAECHTCHGPDGMGSTYAPALVDSLKRLSYEDFTATVIQGRQNVGGGKESVMPSFGTNNNVACYLDDIYVYLKARSDDALGRVRPAKRDDKPAAAKEAENVCLGAS